jgi:hypothetical protein
MPRIESERSDYTRIGGAGGDGRRVELFEDSLVRTGADFVVYHRVSSRSQASNGRLDAKTNAVQLEARRIRDLMRPERRLRRVFRGIELGQLSAKRPVLTETLDYARQHGLIVVAVDVSRLIRSESYNRWYNNEAVPTADELSKLMKLAEGVPAVSTILDPSLSEKERHRLATIRTGKQGRPSRIDQQTQLQIIEAVQYGDESYQEIADRFHLSGPQAVYNVWKPWRDQPNPSLAYLMMLKKQRRGPSFYG